MRQIYTSSNTPSSIICLTVLCTYSNITAQSKGGIIQMPKDTKNPADCLNNRQGILENQTRLLTLILRKFIVSQSPMEPREIKGLEIAAKTKLTRKGKSNIWLVPSQSGLQEKYAVALDSDKPSCTCRDHEFTNDRASIFLLSSTPSSASSRRMVRP